MKWWNKTPFKPTHIVVPLQWECIKTGLRYQSNPDFGTTHYYEQIENRTGYKTYISDYDIARLERYTP